MRCQCRKKILIIYPLWTNTPFLDSSVCSQHPCSQRSRCRRGLSPRELRIGSEGLSDAFEWWGAPLNRSTVGLPARCTCPNFISCVLLIHSFTRPLSSPCVNSIPISAFNPLQSQPRNAESHSSRKSHSALPRALQLCSSCLPTAPRNPKP